MENKKTIIGIIIVVILIIALIVLSYLYYKFNTEQVKKLTEESNILLQMDLATGEINQEIKTEKNFAVVEKSMKEYLTKMQNIYKEIDELCTNINPDNIFVAQNVENKSFEKVETIIEDYKEKATSLFEEYKELEKEENIKKYIEEKNFSRNKDYYIELYNSVMLNDSMKGEYSTLESKIEKIKDQILNKIKEIEEIQEFLVENEKYWKISDDKIQFTNVSIMTKYYELLSQIVED